MKANRIAIICAMLLTSCSGLDAGWRAHNSGDYDKAQREAIIALAKEPGNPEVYRLVASTASAKGDFDRAMKAAEYSLSLDGGDEKTEKLIRNIAAQKKDWKSLCQSALRSTNKGNKPGKDEHNTLRMAADQLSSSMTGESYGCIHALENTGTDVGMDVTTIQNIKLKYASSLSSSGKHKQALELAQSMPMDDAKPIIAGEMLALNQKDKAAEILKSYISAQDLDSFSKEIRISQASSICEKYYQWNLQAEILSHSKKPENILARGIALRKAYRPDESNNVLNQYLKQEKDEKQAIADIKYLFNEGYPEIALDAYQSCTQCSNNENFTFEVANLLKTNHKLDSSARIIDDFANKDPQNIQIQRKAFDMFFQNKQYPLALKAGERILANENAKQVNDFHTFYGNMLEAYVKTREINTYIKLSDEWIHEFPEPGFTPRKRIARIEADRSNWSRVTEILLPLVQSKQIETEDFDLYIRSLSVQKEYEKLYQALDDADIPPQKKATYFQDLDAEDQFRKSIEPLLNGTPQQKLRGEMLTAAFMYDLKEDTEEGKAAIARALQADNDSPLAYQETVEFLFSRDKDLFVKYAQKWIEAHPDNLNPYKMLGAYYLSHHQLEQAESLYSKYIYKSPDKYNALSFVYSEYLKNKEDEAGLVLLKNQCNDINDIKCLAVLTDSKYQYLQTHRNNSVEFKRLKQDIIQSYITLSSHNPEKALRYGVILNNLEAHHEAVASFDRAYQNNRNLKLVERIAYIDSMIHDKQDSHKIHQIINDAGDEKSIIDIADKLSQNGHLHYAETALVPLLKSNKYEIRNQSYRYLISIAHAQGKLDKIRKYNETFEKNWPEVYDVRLMLAETAMELHQWNEAARHMTWMQAMRPDAREVIQMQLTLHRRAPENESATILITSTLKGAEGVAHRLDWIAQYYEQYSDWNNAILYAEKAYAASTIQDFPLQIRLLKIYLRSGKFDSEKSKQAQEIIESIRHTSIWNAETLSSLADVAHKSGYFETAQLWMNEASLMKPDHQSIRSRKLEMALESGHEGQIALSMEKAISHPPVTVIDPLKSTRHIMDIVDTVDLLRQNGEHATSYSYLEAIMPEYLQAKGIATTRRVLMEYLDPLPHLRHEIADLFAQNQWMSDDPCNALSWGYDLDSPSAWARIALRCPDAQPSVMTYVNQIRASKSLSARKNFDNQFYQVFIESGQPDLAREYISLLSIEPTSLEKFENSLHTGDMLTALRSLVQSPVSDGEHLDVIRLLSVSGYVHESIQYAHEHLHQIPKDDRPKAAAMAILLGDRSNEFKQALSEGNPSAIASLDENSTYLAVSSEIMTNWLKNTETSQFNDVVKIALTCAAHDPSRRSQILNELNQELQLRSEFSSTRVFTAMNALNLGLDDFALGQIEQLETMNVSSDFIQRIKAIALVHAKQDTQAMLSLDEGAKYTSLINDYWERVATEHHESSIEVRSFINQRRLELSPRNADLVVERIKLTLENNDTNEAVQLAKAVASFGNYQNIQETARKFEQAKALDSLPADFLKPESSTSLEIKAKTALIHGNHEESIRLYSEAAKIAPWPIDVYERAAESMMENHQWNAAEQLIAKMDTEWPNAYTPKVYRAIYDLYQGKTNDAFQGYLTAIKMSFDTKKWIKKLIQTAIRTQNLEFVHLIYQNESKFGSLDTTVWMDAILDYYLNKSNATIHQQKPQEFANSGILFMEKMLPAMPYVVGNNEQLRQRMSILSTQAQRNDWIQRLGVVSL